MLLAAQKVRSTDLFRLLIVLSSQSQHIVLIPTMFGILLRFREGPFSVHAIINEPASDDDREDLPVDPRMKQLDPANRDQIFKLQRESLDKAGLKEPAKAPKETIKVPAKGNPAERQNYNEEYLDSFKTLEEAKRMVGKVVKFYQKAGFVCGNFVTNSGALKKAICQVQPLDKMIKTAETRWINESDGQAGNQVDIYWDTKNDFLVHRIRIKNFGDLPSRRDVQELVSKLDDPLGLMSNTTIILQMLLQKLHQTSTPWDGQLTGWPKRMWNTWLTKVGIAGYSTIPRSLTKERETKHQLHAFVGASTSAIAACVYLRSSSHQNEQATSVGLAAASSKVVPINHRKPQSMLLVEFEAAVLGAQLVKQVQDETRLKLEETSLWTDSRLLLDAIATPQRWRHATSTVKKSIEKVLELTKQHQWRLIPEDQNPAATVFETLD